MISAGIWQLRAQALGEPVRIGASHWSGMLAGAAIIIVAFAMDFRNIMLGGMPRQFSEAR